MADPLSRALGALRDLDPPDADLVSLGLWQELREALTEARDERHALLAVAGAARRLEAALHAYDAATETEDDELIFGLAAACTAAELGLAEALRRLPADAGMLAHPSAEDRAGGIAGL